MAPQRVSKPTERKQTHASPSPAWQPHVREHLLLQLQQTVGNQALLQLLRSGVLQTKLAVSQPGDIHEQGAEQVAQLAQRVMRMRQPVKKNKNEHLVQAKETPHHVSEVAPAAYGHLAALRRGGQPKRAADSEKASAPQAKKETESLPAVDEGASTESAAEAAVGKEIPRAPAIPDEDKESTAGAAVGKETLRSAATPDKDPAFQEAKKQVRTEAKKQKKNHAPASQKREEAEKASALEEVEQIDQSSKEKSTKEMEQVGAEQQNEGKNFSADKFKEDLKSRINAKGPKNESEAKAFAQKPPLEHFQKDFSDGIAKKQGEVTGPLEEKAKPEPTGGVTEKPIVEVPNPAHPPAPKPVDPKLATPKPKADQEISLQTEGERLDGTMQENRLSDEQLAESREPSFAETLKIKQEAKQKVAEAPGVYRQKEAEILQGAEAQTNESLATELEGMSKIHQKMGGKIFSGQQKTESKTEKRQREIKETIDGIYKGTVDAVKDILEGMASKVKKDFADSLKQKTDDFNNEVRRRISNYYGNWRIDDALFGPDDVVIEDGKTRSMTLEEKFGVVKANRINPDVYRIFVEEKDKFIAAMDGELTNIANNVQLGLSAAHLQIQLGKTAIAFFKATLKGAELVFAEGLEKEVEMKFQTLEGSIDDTREDLLQTLSDQYTENVNQLETTFKDINDELKKSWIDRAIEFIETVGKTIFQLAELLLSILVRVAHLVWDIIKHPIRFFETLVSGLKQGIGMFIENVGTYLQEAFWTWITGATPAKNIRLSASSGIESLFDVVMQVLSLGPAELRAIVEKVLGKEFMQMVDKVIAFGEKAIAFGEKALEPVTILLTKGPMAFWQYIKDTLGSIIQSSFDRIRESVFNAFVEKGLKWIAGFFIPGGGFVKIVKAIFSAFQFVAENLENIRHFFDSIFDSMEAAVAGRTEGVASKIITGLKAGVVLALDFLAKQLGLNKIVDSVQKIIQSLRRPIVSAIEWILGKVKPFVMRMMKKGKELLKKGKAAVGLGGKPEEKPKEGEVTIHAVTFTAAGVQHRLWTELKAGKPVLMIASNGETFGEFIAGLSKRVEGVSDEKEKSDLQTKIGQAKQMAKETEVDFAKVAELMKAEKFSGAEQKEDEVLSDEQKLADILKSALQTLPAGDEIYKTPEEKNAAKTVAGNILDIAHSGYTDGWAGKAAVVKEIHKIGLPSGPVGPHVVYEGKIRKNGSYVAGIKSGIGSFGSYSKAWRREQAKTQQHHIASNKGSGKNNFTSHPAFQPPSIDINDKHNLIDLYGHASRHSDSYHDVVREALDQAVERAKGNPANLKNEVIKALNYLRGEIILGNLKLYPDKEVWE